MLTFLGILFLIIAAIAYFWKKIKSDVDAQNAVAEQYNAELTIAQSNGERRFDNRKTVRNFPKMVIPFKPIVWVIVGLFIMLMPYLWFFADRGYNYLLVYPNGKMSAVMEQGIKWRGFAKIDKWDKYIDVKVVDETSDIKDIDAIEGVMKPVPIRFIDQVTAKAKISARFQLPKTEDSFINLAVEFKSLDNLIQTTLIPTVKEIISNTGYMFAAQDYISGEAQNFRTTFEEQLSDGSYVVNKITTYDTIYSEIDKPNTSRTIQSIKTNYSVNKVLVNGVPKRVPNEITKNGILVSQVVVDDVMLEATFKERLEKQRDESAKRQLEQQKIKTAKDAQQRIIAEGERDKAAERVAQEKEQVKALIAIETKLKQEETNKKLAAIALETEKLKAKSVQVAADAEAYKNRKLVASGLTPQERALWGFRSDSVTSANFAKMVGPTTVIQTFGENAGGNGDITNSLIQAEMAKRVLASKANQPKQ